MKKTLVYLTKWACILKLQCVPDTNSCIRTEVEGVDECFRGLMEKHESSLE